MDRSELWQRYRDLVCDCPDVGLRLDLSRLRFAEGFWDDMAASIREAYDAMERLEAGDIANPDEDRMVGHYWLRAPSLAPTDGIARQITETVDAVESFASDVHAKRITPPTAPKFTDVLLIGIGGSALGPQLVADALAARRDRMRVHFLDNTDPDGIARTLQALRARLKATLVLVVSKSGGTPETRNGMLETQAVYDKLNLDFARHAVAITGEGSKLDQTARDAGWLARFPMWDWVGGRTSVTSAVGLLPAALQGIDIRAFLKGAADMDHLTRRPDTERNPAARLALAWYHATDGRGLKDMVVLPYKDRLLLLSRYLQQLVMESLGKQRDLDGRVVQQGIAVYGNKGSTDQHAYVQQLRDGLNNFFVTFIVVLRDASRGVGPGLEVEPGVTSGDYLNGFWQGTREALTEGGRESITITVDRLDPHRLGALIALYERAVGFYASLINVNAYHQPGVEAGKKAAGTVLELQRQVVEALRERAGEAMSAEQIAGAVGQPDRAETVYHVLEHLAANRSEVLRRRDQYLIRE